MKRMAVNSQVPNSQLPTTRERRPLKPFTRRRGDRSQQIRRSVQYGFAAVTLVVAGQFYLWVRYYESAGATLKVGRPPGVEAWLPIASLMNLKSLLMTGAAPPAHAAGMFMLMAFLVISVLCRKAFCSWICPIGTLSERLWQFGRSAFGRNAALPRWLDVRSRPATVSQRAAATSRCVARGPQASTAGDPASGERYRQRRRRRATRSQRRRLHQQRGNDGGS